MNCRTFDVLMGIVACGLMASSSHASTIWNESVNGSLSTVQASPSTFTLADGVNSIIGSVTTPTNARDFITVTIPAGHQLKQYVNAAYSSTDLQGFTGFQIGTTITGNIGATATFNGWSHYGVSANNTFTLSFPTFNSVGVDLLPVMLSQSVPQGAQGFTLPLVGGRSYSFMIQQTGSALTNYQYDFVVQSVPEPGCLALLATFALGLAGFVARRRAI